MQLLVAALHRTVALAQGDVVAEVVGQHLDLHVARAQHELLQVDAVVAERGTCLVARGLVLRLEVGRVVHLAHALAAASCRGLDEHGVAHAVGERLGLGRRVDAAVGAGHGGHAAGLHGLARHALVAHALDAVGGRPNEYQVVVRAGAREVGVLGQKAVARMDGFRARVLGGRDDARHDQVASWVRLGGPDAHGLVGVLHRVCVRVFGGVHRDGLHAQLFAGAHDAQRHLAAVRHQYLAEHYALSGPTASWVAWGSM